MASTLLPYSAQAAVSLDGGYACGNHKNMVGALYLPYNLCYAYNFTALQAVLLMYYAPV